MQALRVIVLGATGQLGSELVSLGRLHPAWQVYTVTHADLEITRVDAVQTFFDDIRPQVVFNTIAYNQVEQAERDPQQAMKLNATAVQHLAECCRQRNTFLVHFSTDYVFDGKKGTPYTEIDPTAPLNVYGKSKLAGEEAIRSILPRHAILRTCSLYGKNRSPRGKMNFVETMLDRAKTHPPTQPIRVRKDLVISPTAASELARAAYELLERDLVGTFHAVNSGTCTWFDFAEEIFKIAGLSPELEALPPQEIKGVQRPAFSALLPSKDISMTHWKDALARYLKNRS